LRIISKYYINFTVLLEKKLEKILIVAKGYKRSVEIDIDKMVTAFVLIMTKTGKEKEVISELQRMDGIKEAWAVYGDYDIIAKATVSDLDRLNSLLLQKIRSITNISMTSTLIGL